ncbi:MAG: hypothetical protein KAI64_05980, partial [Thermoplasmata archaeon]|nr:hypothetical protein [Thermoplasmata archaeon]
IYYAETSALTQTGEYKVVIEGTNGGNTEEFVLGFRVESIHMMVDAINPKYVEQQVQMNAFAPGMSSNISLAVFMINTSAGSKGKEGGPPCAGGSCLAVDCSDYSQFTVTVRDDEGNKFKLNGTNLYYQSNFDFPTFSSMSLNDAIQNVFIVDPPEDEPGLDDVCIIILWPGNYSYTYKEGNYMAEVSFYNKTIGDLRGSASYSLQRYYASGSTVDFIKGDKFAFLSPNSSVRIKIEIRDMLTDYLLNSSAMLDLKIIEMWKEWPDRKDAFSSDMPGYTREVANATVNGSFIEFTSPPEEGFYMAKFRFKIQSYGLIEEGVGDLFFDLKKYMIWADLSGRETG